jgi:hypothetical protein
VLGLPAQIVTSQHAVYVKVNSPQHSKFECTVCGTVLLLLLLLLLFIFSQYTMFPASRPSTGRCVFLHRAMLQMSRWLYRTHCRDTRRAPALVSKSGSLMTCVRQRMTDFICQTLPSLLGKEFELLFKKMAVISCCSCLVNS